MSPPLFFALPADREFADRLARAVGGDLGELTTHQFPDGETYIRLDTSAANRTVVVVASLNHPNEKLFPITLIADAAHELGATHVGLVAPYLAYMRQDKRFLDGEAIAATSFAGLISHAFDSLVTIDPHLHRIRTLADIYRIPAIALHATTELGKWIATNVASPVLVGPDDESRQWVSAVAAVAQAPFVVLSKTRRGDSDVSVSVPELSQYPTRKPVLVDDIISTGQTMAAAVRHIRETRGVPSICVAVHAVCAEGAISVLDAAGAEFVVTTNTISHPSNRIDVVPMLAAELVARPGFLAN